MYMYAVSLPVRLLWCQGGASRLASIMASRNGDHWECCCLLCTAKLNVSLQRAALFLRQFFTQTNRRNPIQTSSHGGTAVTWKINPCTLVFETAGTLGLMVGSVLVVFVSPTITSSTTTILAAATLSPAAYTVTTTIMASSGRDDANHHGFFFLLPSTFIWNAVSSRSLDCGRKWVSRRRQSCNNLAVSALRPQSRSRVSF
jgi:hypothetical protein